MFLQLEYYADILKSLHPGIYFIFMFDHLCRQDRGIEVGLNVMKSNSGYGREQQEMHPTKTNQEVGYLSLHEQVLYVCDDHQISFQ